MPHMKPEGSDISALIADLPTPAKTLWAKSDFAEGVDWLPLYQHIADSAAVAGILWDDFLPESTKRVVASGSGGDAALARKVTVWLAAAHDLGKASPAFAVQVDRLRLDIEEAGLPFHPSVQRNRAKLPHSMASYLILRTWLETSQGFSRKKAAMFAAVPLGHHGTFSAPPREYDGGNLELLGTGTAWDDVQLQLADFAASLAGLTPEDFARLAGVPPTQSSTLVSTGFTILTDWIASNTDYFPLRATPRDSGAARAALRRLDLPPAWKAPAPADPQLFADHLGLAEPRPLQTELVGLARTIRRPELVILEAPTGDGKTKAAFGCCQVLANRFHLGGVLFALPTQATSDGIFGTVRDWLDTIQGTDDVSLSLAHGKAAFNPEFQKITAMSRIFDETESTDGRTVAHSYLTGRTKLATMSDFVVGTIDQLLLGALRAKHVVLRHLGVAGKVVVIDEVHAADSFMRRYLCRMLTWLAAYDVPVIAMSATLTPSIRHELITAYNDGLGRTTPPVDANEAIVYPRITVTSDHGAEVTAVPASARSSTVSISELPGDTDTIAAAALDAAAGGGNVAVVCDTVRRAQDVYRTLRDTSSSGVEIMLLHSRFLTPDRMAKERALRDRLGPDAPRDGKPLIVVATQVIEQSLDIDFDVMFSDIAPIDLLIQRVGRLHRHEWKDAGRPSAHRTPRLILTGITRSETGPPEFDRGCRSVYGAYALLRCLATLGEHFATRPALTSPGDVAPLVTRAYESITAPPGWEKAWAQAQAAATETDHQKRLRAGQFLIDPPSRKLLVGWGLQPAPDPTGERGVAQVRDSEDTIEVVVIQSVNGRRKIPSWAAELADSDVDLGTVIDDDVARAAAKNTLRLPGFLGSPGIGDELIGELEDGCIDTWQNSRWLRGVLPLVLDVNGNAEHVDRLFHYDTDLGLVVTPLEKQ